MRLSLALLVALLAYLVPLAGSARHYETEWHESRWRVSETRLECGLVHEITYYGRAVFTNHALHGMSFRLETLQPGRQDLRANFSSERVEWKPGDAITKFFGTRTIAWHKGSTPAVLDHNLAITMLAELEQGRKPVLRFTAKPAPNDLVSVALSVVRFRPAYLKFLHCRDKLGKFDLKEVGERAVHFDTAKHTLKTKDQRALDKIAAYVLHHSSAVEIRVDGHTDAVGTHAYNLGLSKRRAQAVKTYLVQQRVPASSITTRYFGKKNPVATNHNAEGRQKNRRSEIKLLSQ